MGKITRAALARRKNRRSCQDHRTHRLAIFTDNGDKLFRSLGVRLESSFINLNSASEHFRAQSLIHYGLFTSQEWSAIDTLPSSTTSKNIN